MHISDTKAQYLKKVRIQRSLLGFTMYVVVAVMLLLGINVNAVDMPYSRLYIYIIIAFFVQSGFVFLFWKGFNLRLKEPNLAAEQMTIGFFWLTVAMVEGSRFKGIIALTSLGVLLYGVFGLPKRSFFLLPVLAVLGLAIANIQHYIRYPEEINLLYSAIEFIVFTAVVAWITFIASYTIKIRLALKEQKQTLRKTNDMLAALSVQDSLTGLKNRRHFDENLKSEWGRSLRNQTDLALIIVDIDYFKKFNDEHGHDAGDECLRQISKTLSNSVRRSSDFVSRYGGEEFAITLPNTTLECAEKIAYQVLEEICTCSIEYNGEIMNVTASLGVAAFRAASKGDCYDLFRAADGALYNAKSAGRNCVKCSDVLEC